MNSEVKVSSASPAKKKQMGGTKKFVASSGGAKRRPLLPRRLSSQSSTGSETGPQGSSAGSRASAIQRAVSPIPEASSTHVTPESGDKSTTMLQATPALSAKAAGKRPALPRRTTAEKKATQKSPNRSPASPVSPVPPALQRKAETPPTKPAPSRSELPQAQSFVDLPFHSRGPSESARPTLGASGLSWAGHGMEAPAAMARSQSHGGYDRFKSGKAPTPPGLFTGATASTTNVAAQGTIIDQSGLSSVPTPSAYERKDDDYALPSRPSASSLLESRFTPTQPSTSASVPLGRTRSQLTLLLERDQSRTGEKSRSKN